MERSATAIAGHATPSAQRMVGAFGLVLVPGLLVPGLGLVIALILAFTGMRHAPATVRWGLVLFGVVTIFVGGGVGASWAPFTSSGSSPPSPAHH